MMITALLSCLKPSANKLERLEGRMQEKQAQFVVLNTRAGRILLDIIGERRDLVWLRDRLTDLELDPIVIAAFRQDNGRKLRDFPVDRPAWRAVAPDIQTGVDGEGNPIMGRPPLGDFRQVHAWFGWPIDDEQDED